MAKRSKDNRILVRIGEDSRKRLARNAALEKAASDRTVRRKAKKAATRLRRSQREIAKRAMQLARRLARERARDARREAKRREREQRRRDRDDDNGDRPKRKRPFHPRGPYATEKYTSYARRAERAKSLKGNRISPTICMVNGYTVRYSGNKAVSCTCDDFTQGSWVGSAAGPFNPCKHMMAECQASTSYYWEASGVLYGGSAPGFCVTPAVSGVIRSGTISFAQFPVTAVIDDSFRPLPPGCPGKHHYKFVDAFGTELAYVGSSSDGYTITYLPS